MSETKPVCALCGEPMPAGEEMFNYHGYSGPCPKPPLPQQPTLQEYFEAAERKGVCDFSLRIMRTPEGHLDFYIHPAYCDGETGDFNVSGGFVSKLTVGAGSSRPRSKPFLGSDTDNE